MKISNQIINCNTMENHNRRTGRTTILILEAIAELYRNGKIRFVDHYNYDGGGEVSTYAYKKILDKIKKILMVLTSAAIVESQWDFKVLPNGEGIYIEKKP